MKTLLATPYRFAGLLVLLSALLLTSSCGKEDLYEIPESPFPVVGHLPLPSVNKGVEVLGNYAYVAAGQAGFHVVDITNPASPILVTTINTTKYAEGVRVLRTFTDNTLQDIVMVVEGTEGVTSYDITNPTNPIDFDQGTTAVDANRFFLEVPEDPNEPFIGYLAESWKGLRIFFSIPDRPGVLDYPGIFGGTRGVAMDVEVKDGWAYVADDQMGIAVIDVHVLQLGQVELVEWEDTPGNAVAIDVVGDFAYIADKRQGMTIFEIDGGTKPVVASQIHLDSWCLDVEVRGGYAFIAADDAGMHVVDVSDPYNPVYAGNIRTPNATGIHVTDSGLILLTDEDAGLYIMQGPGSFADKTPPASTYGLEAETLSFVRAGLSWFAPGDDRYQGRADAYDIRYSLEPIVDEASWNAATPAAGPTPSPAAPGELEVFDVTGLAKGVKYHFALKTGDESGQWSGLSVSDSTTTLAEGTYIAASSVTPYIGEIGGTYTFEAIYQDAEADAPVVHSIIINGGDPIPMTYVSGDFDDLARYTHSQEFPLGAHTHAFLFDDGNGNVVQTNPVFGPLAGDFWLMGSPTDELCRIADGEGSEAQYAVSFLSSFIADPLEVIQLDWEALMPTNPSYFIGDSLPVDRVTWLEAVTYCNALSQDKDLTPAYTIDGDFVTWDLEADGWRLPTEAEWEYLARAGTATAFSSGDIEDCGFSDNLDEVGWYLGNSSVNTIPTSHIVGGKEPNAFGLYDMHGNVMEWCWDFFGPYPNEGVFNPTGPEIGYTRVARGGSWDQQASKCRSAAREERVPDSRDNFMGLRVVRTTVTP